MLHMNVKVGLVIGAVVASCAFASSTLASPHPLPFSYPYETQERGASEIELYNDVNPLRVNRDAEDPTKGRLWEPELTLQSAYEYGLTDKWEIAFYQVFKGEPVDGGDQHFKFDGFKWRARTRFFEQGDLPIDIGLYLEIVTLHDELEFEERLILQRRFGSLRVMANLWVEQEIERPFDDAEPGKEKELEFFVNPTLGATYEVTPLFHPGIEYWARGMLSPEGEDRIERRNNSVHHYVGPALHFNFGQLWATAGLYAHLNDVTRPTPGETNGPFWFRMLVGINL